MNQRALPFNMRFQWGKQLISAIWPRRPNYPSNIFFFVLIVFVDPENMGKKPKIMILLYTVQKLWLFVIYESMVLWSYLAIIKIAITFEPYILESWFLAFYPCFRGLRTRLKQIKKYWMDSLVCGAKWRKWAVFPIENACYTVRPCTTIRN